MRDVKIAFVVLIVLVAFFGCKSKTENQKPDDVVYTCPMHPEIVQEKPGDCPVCGMKLVKKQKKKEATSLRLNDSEIRLANITTGIAQMNTLTGMTTIGGRLTIDERSSTVISSRVSGRIEKLFFTEAGRPVRKGQPLYEIYSREMQELIQDFITAQQQVATGNSESALAFLRSAKRKLTVIGLTDDQIAGIKGSDVSSGTTIVSPVDGVVSEVDVTVGQSVAEGFVLFKTAALEKLWLSLQVFNNEADLLKEGQSVDVRIQGFENEKVTGKIVFISPVVNGNTNSIRVRVSVENGARKFAVGMQAFVTIIRKAAPHITVPADAVLHDGARTTVWIRSDDGSFAPREVKTGAETLDQVEILNGVNAGEHIVVTGAYLLSSEMMLRRS